MGIDLEYQAMPPDCELIWRSRIGPDFGSYLALFGYFSERIPEEKGRTVTKRFLIFSLKRSLQ
jgi:hypothetical protein